MSLESRVRRGIIRSAEELNNAFRALSKELHPDTSGLDHHQFADLLTDRDRALELLSLGEQESVAAAKQDFWQLFQHYSRRGYPKREGLAEPPTRNARRIVEDMLKAGKDIHEELFHALQIYNSAFSKPDIEELNWDPCARSFYSGLEHLFRWKENEHRRSKKLARIGLEECRDRILLKDDVKHLALLPITLALLVCGFERVSVHKELLQPPVLEIVRQKAEAAFLAGSAKAWVDRSGKMLLPVSELDGLRNLGEAVRRSISATARAQAYYAFIGTHFSSFQKENVAEKLKECHARLRRYQKAYDGLIHAQSTNA